MNADKNTCFVIMPIGDAKGYEKGHFTRVYNSLLKPAIFKAGYHPERADEIQSTNLIALDIVERISRTPIAICDISSCNPNVFYELGIRHSSSLPVVLVKDKKTNNPFDIKDIRYIEYSERLEYDDVIKKHEEISTVMINTIENYKKEGYKNSLLSLISQARIAQNRNSLNDNTDLLEKEAMSILNFIDSADVDNELRIMHLIESFYKICKNNARGKSLFSYLKTRYENKFTGIINTFMLDF